MTPNSLLEILQSIEQGKITPEEGLKRMNALRADNSIDSGIPEPHIENEIEGTDANSISAEAPPQVPDAIDEASPAPVVEAFQADISPSIDGTTDDTTPIGKTPPDPAEQINPEPQPQAPEVSTPPQEPPTLVSLENNSTDQGTAEKIVGEPVGEKDAEREITYWKQWWLVPFWIGTVITVLGALIMYLGYEAAHFGFVFWLAWFPFFIGVFIIALSWQNRMTHWLHVRIHQKPGEKPGKISISLPLPLGLAAWFLRNFGHLIPGLNAQKLTGAEMADMISALEKAISLENPFYVHINGDDGEEVEVFIG